MSNQVGNFILCGDYLCRQQLPSWQLYKCTDRQTNQEYLIKIWYAKNNQLVDYKALFAYEVSLFRELGKTPLGKFLPELVAENPVAILICREDRIPISYQLFHPIKHRSLVSYGPRVLAPTLSHHLLRQIISFIISLHTSFSLSFFSLHPDHILIDSTLSPRFVNIMNMRPLSYSDELGDTFISKEFMSPQMTLRQRFNSQRLDSFQLGVLACWIMCGAPCSQSSNTQEDRLYGRVCTGRYQEFWKWLKCANKPESLKEMILALIQPEEEMRIDPFVIRNLPWWNQPYQQPEPNTLELIQAEELKKREAKLEAARLQAEWKEKRKHKAAGTRSHIGLSASSSSSSQDEQAPSYPSNSYLNCYFYPNHIQSTYRMLRNKCTRDYSLKRQDPTRYRLIVQSQATNGDTFLVQISCYVLRETPGVTVVQYSMYEGEVLYANENYNDLVTTLEAREEEEVV